MSSICREEASRLEPSPVNCCLRLLERRHRSGNGYRGQGCLRSSESINFIMPFGGADPLPQLLTIPAADNSTFRFTADCGDK